MSQASTARATALRSPTWRNRLRLTGATAVLLLVALPAAAQQYGSVGNSVTVDYGVLDSLGNGGTNLPGLLSGAAPQGAPYAYANPYGAAPYPPAGQLLTPPASSPRSTLTSQQPGLSAGAAPAGPDGAIKLIPPSEFKKKVAATAPSAPAPAPAAPPPPTTQAAVEPPPPPTPIEPAPAAPSAAAVPMPEAPAASAPDSAAAAQQAAAEPPPPPAPPPLPEPAAAQPAPAPDPEPVATPESEPAAAAPEPETAAATTPDDAGAPAEAEAEAAPAAAGDTQEAALPPQAAVEGQISVSFAEGASALSDDAKAALDGVAEQLRGDDSLRVQLLAYAKAIDDNTSRARRMSLSRALEVRSYLIEKGVRSTRMDVRALGSNVEGEPADRVDIIPQAQ